MSSESNSRHRRPGLFGRLVNGRARRRVVELDPLLRICTQCAEAVYVLAERCRYCGATLTIPVRVA